MRILARMNVLLVQPLAPKTYWGFQYAVGIVGKGAPHPPLGLATLAALLPGRWNLRILDLNVAPFEEEDLRWADAVLVTGMLVHSESMHAVISRAHRTGLRTVVGGPAASSRPDEFVDANFIGNRREAAKLLPEIARWQDAHHHPFELYTEASVDLAALPALVESMVTAGFTTVFLGIETPSAASLKETRKLQNLKLPLQESVMRLTRAGLEVYAGFIVGFDSDGEHIFEAQRAFISGLPIAAAMIGLLTALPNTALWRRLEKEGRLRSSSTGDQFGRPNFDPVLDERKLLEGYRQLLADIYEPGAFYGRSEALVRDLGRGRARALSIDALLMFVRILIGVGVLSPRRFRFWRLFFKSITRPYAFSKAMSMAVQGEHLIRYTYEDVLPRIDQALAEIATPGVQRAAASEARA